MRSFEPGQRWTYKHRPQDTDSTIVIGLAPTDSSGSATVHITVHDVSEIGTISHMPFSVDALNESIGELIETAVPAGPDFEGGHATWAEQRGGTFTISVAEALDLVVPVATDAQPDGTNNSTNSGGGTDSRGDDGFDQLVVTMRETRSDELIDQLYRKLFGLDQWFFVCEPDDAQVPVQWVFPDGTNPAPALLAFTSRERAIGMAVGSGLYDDGADIGVMEPTVAVAIDWITSDGCANEWLCFNYPTESFPLYVNDADRLFQAIKNP